MKNFSYKRLAGLTLGSIMGITAMDAQADSELVDLLRVLKTNGAINQSQYERLLREADSTGAEGRQPTKKDKKKQKSTGRGRNQRWPEG